MDTAGEYIEAATNTPVWFDAKNESWNDDIGDWISALSDKSYKR